MNLAGKRIGFGITGSHTTYHKVYPQIERLQAAKAEVIPIVSYTVQQTDTRIGKAKDHLATIEKLTNKQVIRTIPEAERLGPTEPLDCMVIAPLTGNSLSKLANAFSDSPVLFAAKSTLRNQKPIILGISTNDALGLNGVNLMKLLATKNIYFVPFGQDDPYNKPNSLIANMDYLLETVKFALKGKQIQPIIIPYHDKNVVK